MKPGDASFYGKDGNLDAAIARYNIHPAKSEFYVRTRAVFLKKIREVAKEGDFVFDMGCSFGYNTCEIAEIYKQLGLNATIVGFDLKSQQIKNAKELAKRKGLDNVKFRVFDALAIEHLIKDYEPTLITSLYSFHHIPDGKEDIHSNKIKVLQAINSGQKRCDIIIGDVTIPVSYTEKDNPEEKYKYDLWEFWASPRIKAAMRVSAESRDMETNAVEGVEKRIQEFPITQAEYAELFKQTGWDIESKQIMLPFQDVVFHCVSTKLF